jgi:plastocyanin
MAATSLFVAGCFHTPPESVPVTPETSMEKGIMEETSMEEGVMEFVVEGSEFKFDPQTMTVPVGTKVRIVFKNMGDMTHDWRLDEFSAATAIIGPGQEETIEFVADVAGEYEYYCSVNTHRQMGMVGILTVE